PHSADAASQCFCSLHCSAPARHLPSFPTRRSSDLGHLAGARVIAEVGGVVGRVVGERGLSCRLGGDEFGVLLPDHDLESGMALRSEEHTSELQSRENLVCRLLLEKKKERIEIDGCR